MQTVSATDKNTNVNYFIAAHARRYGATPEDRTAALADLIGLSFSAKMESVRARARAQLAEEGIFVENGCLSMARDLARDQAANEVD